MLWAILLTRSGESGERCETAAHLHVRVGINLLDLALAPQVPNLWQLDDIVPMGPSSLCPA